MNRYRETEQPRVRARARVVALVLSGLGGGLALECGAATFEHISRTAIVAPMPPTFDSLPVRDSSTNGRYAVFSSQASNLISGDLNEAKDIFVHDRVTGTLERASITSNETEPVQQFFATFPSISGDGNKVVFEACAAGLDVAEPGQHCGIYLRDRGAGTTTIISRDLGGTVHAGIRPTISRDGRYVAYVRATFDGVDSYNGDLVRKDLQTGALVVASVAPDASPVIFDLGGAAFGQHSFSGNGIHAYTLSANGDRVAFVTDLALPGASDNDAVLDIYVRSIGAASTALVSVADDETDISAPTWVAHQSPTSLDGSVRWVSADASRIAFSTAQNLHPSDLPRGVDVDDDAYLRDTTAAATLYVSQSAGGVGGDQTSWAHAVSDDGVKIALTANASNLDPTNRSGTKVKNLGDDTFVAVSVDPNGEVICCLDRSVHLSGDGLRAMFEADDDRLLAADRHAGHDLFSRELATFSSVLLTAPFGGAGNVHAYPNGISFLPLVADDGTVAFASYANNLVAADANRGSDYFVRSLGSGTLRRLTSGEDHLYQPRASSYDMTPDGRYLVFQTLESHAPDDNVFSQASIYRFDRQTDSYVLVDRVDGAGGVPGTNFSETPSVSADGNRVFFCTLSALVPADADVTMDCYLRDVANETTTLLAQVPGNRNAAGFVLSDDGRVLGFGTSLDLLPIDTNGVADAYVLDLDTSTLECASLDRGTTPAAAGGFFRSLSGDGTRVGFDSHAAALTGSTLRGGIFVRDRSAGFTRRVDVDSAGAALIDRDFYSSFGASISADGNFVAFGAHSEDFLPGEGIRYQSFVHDLALGTTVRVSVLNDGSLANFGANAKISPNGRWLAIESSASNLVPPDHNGTLVDIFLTENPLYGQELASAVDTLTPATTEPSLDASVSADARYVAFQSDAANLLGVDTNGATDVFRLDTSNGEVVKISLDDAEGEVMGDAIEPTLSANGTMAAFVAPDAAVSKLFGESKSARAKRIKAGGYGVYLRNILTGTTQRMGRARVDPGAPANPGAGTKPVIAPSGKAIAFASDEDRIEVGDSNGVTDIYVTQFGPGGTSMRCVSCNAVDASGGDTVEDSDGPSLNPVFSAEGDWIAWETAASNLLKDVPDPNPGIDVVIRSLISGRSQRVGTNQGGAGVAGDTTKPRLDYSGRKMVFQSTRSLVPDAPPGRNDAYFVDLDSGQLEQVSVDPMGGQVDGASFEPTISGDGKMIAFTSVATNFNASLPDENGAVLDIIVRDRRTRLTRRLSKNLNGIDSNGDSQRPDLNYSGDTLVFDSSAANLSGADQNGNVLDVFLRDNPINRELIFGTGFE